MSDGRRPRLSMTPQVLHQCRGVSRRSARHKMLRMCRVYKKLYSKNPTFQNFLMFKKLASQLGRSVPPSTESQGLSDDNVSSSSITLGIDVSPGVHQCNEHANSGDNDNSGDTTVMKDNDDNNSNPHAEHAKHANSGDNDNSGDTTVMKDNDGNNSSPQSMRGHCDKFGNDDFINLDNEFFEQYSDNHNSITDTSCTEDDTSTESDERDDREKMEESGNDGDLPNASSEMFALRGTADLFRRTIMRDNVSESQILAMIISLSMRHGLTYQATFGMFKMIKDITVSSSLPTSMAALWQALLKHDELAMVRHLYCRYCKTTVGQGTVPVRDCFCGKSGPGKDKRSLSYFIHVKLIPQLRKVLSTPGVADSLLYRCTRKKKNPDCIEDIYDGKQYRSKCQPGGFLSGEYNYSFTINTDSCKVSNSTNVSAWPVLLTINELPPNARKRHMLLAGIWVHDSHPVLNSLMLPICEELKSLYETGIDWCPDGSNVITSRFVTLICTVDSIARPELLNMTQFNGEYGCTFCYAKGKAHGRRRVYPISDDHSRTDLEIRQNMHRAFRERKNFFGVKGHSALSILPEFDIALGSIVESMHNLYLGVAKQHTMLLLFGSANDLWYRGGTRRLKLINSRLSKIRTPARISIDPRQIQTAKNWKAPEWRNWLIYYCVPCLEGIIRSEDFAHITLLSRAAYILNNDSICTTELQEARLLLKEYTKKFEETFGERNMTFNVHILSHLPDTVENWGPIWAHSAFPFESLNKTIIDSVTSSDARPLQIVTRFLMNRFINNIMHDSATEIRTRILLHSNMEAGKNRRTPLFNVPGRNANFKAVGKVREGPPSDWESEILQTADYRPAKLSFFKRAVIKGNEYRCRGENEKTLFCNKYVYGKNIGFAEILGIVCFSHNGDFVYGLFVDRLADIGNVFEAPHIRHVVSASAKAFITIEEIEAPVVMIFKSNTSCAIKMPNIWEAD